MKPILCLLLSFFAAGLVHASALEPALQAKVDAKLAQIKAWAAAPEIIDAVVAQNASLPTAYADMTQEKWKSLTVLDPLVRGFTRNPAGAFLRSKKPDWVAEAFVSDDKGRKVAFLAKTTNWSHASSAKHAKPFAGQDWQGEVELDESTGLQQIQVGVPVLKDGAPVGSLVVGLALSKLE